MSKKYESMALEIPIQGRNGNIRLGAVMDGSFFGWESMSMRYGLVDGEGMIPEETDKLHTHEYDQIIWLLSGDPDDMLHLGAELEVDLGEKGVRHLIATPHVIVIPKGTPHFSPIVRSVERPFYFVAMSCTAAFRAEVTDEAAMPGSGEWCRFFGEFANNVKPLTFSANDPYHYGSSRVQASGGVSAHVNSMNTKVPLTMTWSTVQMPHNLGPWGADGKHHPHTHADFDEMLMFLSLDQNNLTDLHAVADFCVGEDGDDQEHYILTKATIMAMKKGTPHLPLTFTEVSGPTVFITCGNH